MQDGKYCDKLTSVLYQRTLRISSRPPPRTGYHVTSLSFSNYVSMWCCAVTPLSESPPDQVEVLGKM